MKLKPGDLVTVFQKIATKHTLFQTRISYLDTLNLPHVAPFDYVIFSEDEGVTWVRGHVTPRNKLGRTMVAANALLR